MIVFELKLHRILFFLELFLLHSEVFPDGHLICIFQSNAFLSYAFYVVLLKIVLIFLLNEFHGFDSIVFFSKDFYL